MTPPGHLAFAYLMSRQSAPAADRVRNSAFAMFGALVPDIIDKTLWIFGFYPWGRTIGHSVVTWLLVAAHVVIISIVLRNSRPWGWLLLGIASHFLADLTDDMVNGVTHTSYAISSWFLWPFFNPDEWAWRVAPLEPAPGGLTFYEVAVVTLAAVLMLWDRRRLSGKMDIGLEVLDEHPGQHVVPRGNDQS